MARPLGVTILAILQLLGAIVLLAVGVLAFIAGALLLPIIGMLLALFPLIFGIIGLILFYGLWNLKSWAWMWTIIVNILQIIVSAMDYSNNLVQLIISVVIVVYLFAPNIKPLFR
ncbi:MAG: hypothetical protein RTU30_10500 [Candidatus Thorarchaeota archaeon]